VLWLGPAKPAGSRVPRTEMTPSDLHNGRQGDGGPDEAAHYIKGAVRDLSLMARRHRHDMLAYLLDMAHLETEEILRRRDLRKPSRR
jgi:hypothetical protein